MFLCWVKKLERNGCISVLYLERLLEALFCKKELRPREIHLLTCVTQLTY